MKLPADIDPLVVDPDAAQVYGQPHQDPDGTTVIPVAKVRRRGTGDSAPMTARPVGVYVVKDGSVRWVPATDTTRIALLGQLIGLVAAALAGLAMVRRPPWPDLRGDVSRHR